MPNDSTRDASKSIPAPSAYIRTLLRIFAATPALRAKLLAGTDIDATRLSAGGDVTLFSFISFSENLTREIGEDWPLRSMPAWSTAMQGALEVAVRSAPTIGEGVEILARYGHVRGPYLGLRMKRGKANTALFLSCNVSLTEPTRRAMTETALLSASAMLRQMIEGQGSEVEYHLPWAAPKHAAALRDALPGKVKFDQPVCAIVLPAPLCARVSPFADQRLLASAIAELDHDARRVKDIDLLTVRIERLLKRRRAGRVSEDDAARELGMSRRTLVRRLSESATSYRKLLDANLKERAKQLLADRTMSRAEMSEALGFKDPTSFSRACRRWFKAES